MDINYILTEYFDKLRSVDELAEEFNTYPNKIARAIKKAGRKLRNKSESQKVALIKGRIEHPTKGKKVDAKTKNKISKKIMSLWENIDDQTRQERIESYKKRYKNMSQAEKNKLKEAATVGLLKSAKEGSKIEHFVLNMLKDEGYEVVFHKTGLIPNDKLEVDLFLPSLRTAIEIDGVAHHKVVWTEEKLQKTQESDREKSGLLAAYGYKMIRLKYKQKNFGKLVQQKVKEVILKAVETIKNDNKAKYLEVEV